MADKIDSLKIGSTSYDIDLPPDATPSIASLTVSGTTDVSAGTLKAKTLNIPTTSGGSTYGPGSSGQILTSNGTTVYWANASSGANYYHTPSFSSGLKIATGTGVSDLYVPNASTSQAGVVTTGAQTFSGTKTFSNLSTSSFNVEGIWGKGLLDIYDSGDEYASIHLTNDGEYGFIETYANKVSIKGGSSLYIGDDEDVIGGNIHLYDEVSEGYAGILSEDNTIYGYTPSGSSIGFEPDTKNIYINNGSNTRTYTFPDRSGKVALLDDIPSTSDFVKTTGNQTIGGTKTFSDIIISPGIQPSTTASSSYSPNLGATNKKFKNAYLYGYLAVSTDTYAAQDVNSTRYQQGKIINYGTSSSYSVTLQFPTVTSAYTVTLPSKTGTVALTSDIPSTKDTIEKTFPNWFATPTVLSSNGRMPGTAFPTNVGSWTYISKPSWLVVTCGRRAGASEVEICLRKQYSSTSQQKIFRCGENYVNMDYPHIPFLMIPIPSGLYVCMNGENVSNGEVCIYPCNYD